MRYGGSPAHRCDVARPDVEPDTAGLALAIRLRRVRLDIGWTIAKPALALRMSKAELYALESGAEPLRASHLVRAARAYDTSPSVMLPEASDLQLAEIVAALDVGETG